MRYQLGDIRLDTHLHCVSRGGDVVRLTQKEYALLKYLFLHSDNKGSILKINKRILKGYFYKTTTSLYEMVVSCDFLFDDQSLITRISLSSIIICLCPLRTPLPFAWILRLDIKLTAITIVNRC